MKAEKKNESYESLEKIESHGIRGKIILIYINLWIKLSVGIYVFFRKVDRVSERVCLGSRVCE